jgi:hypothetical protein
MTASAQIEIVHRPLERVGADLVVVGVFSDDRPLRGGAARIDWRLCGLISSLLQGGELTGQLGEAVLMPSPGSLRAPRILLLGLGERGAFRMASAQEVMRDAAARCLDLALEKLAIAPIGIASDDFPRHAPALVGGLAEALDASEGALEVRLVIPAQEVDRSLPALESAVRARPGSAISLRPAGREIEGAAVGAAHKSPVRTEGHSPGGSQAAP